MNCCVQSPLASGLKKSGTGRWPNGLVTDGSLYSRLCYSALFACSVSRLWDSHQTVGPYGLPPIDPSPHPLLSLKVSTSVSTNVMRVTFLGKRPWPHYLSTTPMSCDQEVQTVL